MFVRAAQEPEGPDYIDGIMMQGKAIRKLQERIVELEAEAERLRDQLKASVELNAIREEQLSDEIEEVGRLRTALQWIADNDQGEKRNGGDPEWFSEQAPTVARKALGDY